MTERDNFVNELLQYLGQNYSSDAFIVNWQKEYGKRFLQKEHVKKPVLKRTCSVVKEGLKARLLQSYSEEYRDTCTKDDPQLSVESVDKCVESIKTLEHWIKGNKRNIIYYSALQGEAIHNLKKLRRGDTGVFLVQQGVPFSVSHCNALIRLYRLIKEYPQLQNCSIEVGIVLKNMKVIREICKELAW